MHIIKSDMFLNNYHIIHLIALNLLFHEMKKNQPVTEWFTQIKKKLLALL